MGRLLDQTFVYWRGTEIVREPYQAYVPHLVNGWTPDFETDLLQRLQDTTERIRALQQDVSATRPLIWCLNRTEAIATSHVEGIVTTMRSLCLLESLRDRRDPARAERDRQALGAARLNAYAAEIGARREAPISAGDIQEMHRRLFAATNQQIGSGELRDEQNWVGRRSDRTPATALFVPPPHAMVSRLLNDAVAYSSAPQMAQPLAKASVAHMQFETIHPFFDGNGRVGRALLHCILHRDMPHFVPLPLSAAINERKQAYYESLWPYQTYIGGRASHERSNAAAAAADYIAAAADVACDYTHALDAVIVKMRQRWEELHLRRHSAASAVLEAMSTMPAADTSYLEASTGRSARAVRRAVRHFTDSGVLAESSDEDTGRAVFELPEMLQVVDGRDRLITACWDMRADGIDPSPDALISVLHSAASPQAPQEVDVGGASHGATARWARCAHQGERSKTRCVRRDGHAPPHRYT